MLCYSDGYLGSIYINVYEMITCISFLHLLTQAVWLMKKIFAYSELPKKIIVATTKQPWIKSSFAT